MTERRPHWDAELCNAVYDAALEAYKDGLNGGAYDIFPIIAAVEDWQAQRLGACVPQLAAWQYEKQTIPLWHWAQSEATIQRVRDACVSSHVDDKGKKVVFLDRIQRALDGAE